MSWIVDEGFNGNMQLRSVRSGAASRHAWVESKWRDELHDGVDFQSSSVKRRPSDGRPLLSKKIFLRPIASEENVGDGTLILIHAGA